MGVSFKVSRTGKRYKASSRVIHEPDHDDSSEIPESKDLVPLENSSHRKPVGIRDDEIGAGISNQSTDNEISFILNLYTDGYSIARPEEGARRTADSSHLLHPYDRSSDSFFSAIESGRFPRDALDEKHCKFVAGSIMCEVRDFRQNATGRGPDTSPVVHRISLKISLEDVVKDIPLMSDNCWTYGDLMEVESQILKALQPNLHLDPSPQLDRLCRNPIPSKLCLGLRSMRRKRRREANVSEAAVTTNISLNGRKVCIEGDQVGNTQGVQEMVVSFSDNPMLIKRDINEGLMNKRVTLSPNSDAIYHSQKDPSFPVGQTPMRYGTEHLEAEKMNAELHQMRSEMVHFDPQQRLQSQNLTRCNVSQTPWATHKEEQFQNRKSGQSPRVSSGALAQSPLSSKSGELSSGSGGAHFAAASALASQREKSIAPPPKRRSNSFTKTQGISAVGSPASVSTNSQLNANSPSVSTSVMPDQSIMDRFLKIDMTVKRFKLMPARNKVDSFPIRKTNTYSLQMIPPFISNGPLCQDFIIDDPNSKKLSKSLIAGSMNTCKTRVMNFVTPGEMAQGKSRSRLIMMEKPNDGTVAMFYGDVDEDSTLPDEEHLPTLRNSDYADLLATQLCSLMLRDGFVVEDDRVQPKLDNPPTVQMTAPMDRQQLTDAGKVTMQQPSEMKQSFAGASQMNRMLPPGNPQAVLSGSSSMSLRPQLEQQQTQQQQQSMPSEFNQQFQRQHMVNALPHLNTIGGHMSSKASSIQMQMLQQQQTQKQNQMQQRKLMVGLGTAMGMGNLTSNIVGLGGMSSAVGAVGVRGPINMGHLSQTGLGQQIRGQLTPQDVALYNQKMRLAAQSRPGMLGAQGPNRPMVGLRGNLNPMQRGAMGPPKLLSMYANQQQQFAQQQFQLQEATSSFPSSPSTIVMPPMNHPSPQQMNQTTMSPQMSSGPIHPMSGDVCPASPQLSSQTLGSVGSISNSPMDLPSVNKTNSMNNNS